jgi:protein O-GlcNAc transferase
MDASTFLAEALSCHKKGDLDGAEKRYDAVLKSDPGCADAAHLLGIVKRQRGRSAEAISFLEQACCLQPSNILFLVDCADCLREIASFDRALHYYRRALALAPRDVAVLVKVAGLHHAAGNLQAARDSLEEVLAVQPDHVPALVDFAELSRRTGDHAQALKSVQRALALKPDMASAHNTAGLVYEAAGELEKAKRHYREAVRLDENHAEAYNNLGNVMLASRDRNAAVASFRRALYLRPDFFEPLYNLGNCLRDTDALDEALHCFQAAIRLRPAGIEARVNYGEALQTAGNIDEAENQFLQAMDRSGGACAQAWSNLLLCMNYNPKYSPPQLFERHCQFGRAFDGKAAGSRRADPARDPNKKLRIGYVSADFRDHPAARFLEPVLANHDVDSFDVYCYSDAARPDVVTERLKKNTGHWRDLAGIDDIKAESILRGDGIDLLIDCAGHTAGNRLPLLARKPAPVQVSYLGYPMTTGLAAMDYYLTDAILDPPQDASLYTEKLLYIDGCFCTYLPPDNAPGVQELPAEGNGYVTFGSLHTIARLNDRVIALWSRILKDVPTSRLRIIRTTLAGSARERLEKEFARHGIDPQRIELLHEIPPAGHLALYGDIDILLDTFPWSGHTTACESLWMGVPVVTLCGERHAGRMVSTVLKTIRLDEWVASSEDEYRAIAMGKAATIDALKSTRRSLRQSIATSNLCDARRFTQKLEAAYRKIWAEYCK